MPDRNQMRKRALELYGEEMNTLIPRLMQEFKTPYLVANQLGVYATSVRYWLVNHGWVFDQNLRQWVEPAAEAALE
jgi:hypothetical protein